MAAGLDSRPYRLELPASLQWIEIDLPEIVDPKRQILSSEKPRCQLEVITQHLGDEAVRRTLFSQLNQRAHRATDPLSPLGLRSQRHHRHIDALQLPLPPLAVTFPLSRRCKAVVVRQSARIAGWRFREWVVLQQSQNVRRSFQ